MSEGKLLDDLAKTEGCFISSLKAPSEKKKIIQLFQKIPPKQYSLQEWEYSIAYLLGRTVHFASYRKLQAFLNEKQRRRILPFPTGDEKCGPKKK